MSIRQLGLPGYRPEASQVQDGTLCRQPSPTPGPAGRTSDGQTPPPPSRPVSRRQTGRQISKTTPLPTLQPGSHEPSVRTLQYQLNARLTPTPPLPVDGEFGPRTQEAVVKFQQSEATPAAGIVDKTTWFHLLSSRGGSSAPSRRLPPDVAAWSLEERFTYGLEHTAPRLPSALRTAFRAFNLGGSRDAAVRWLTIWAGSWLFGVGRPVTFAPEARLGRTAATRHLAVAEDLKAFLAGTCAAGTRTELEDAAGLLARAIEALDVPDFHTLLRRHEAPPKAEETKVEEKPPPKARAAKTTWIELKIVWECTGEPVPGVRLVFTAPDGNQEYRTTDSSGLIRVDHIEPGECEAGSEMDSALLTNTLDFNGLGEPKKKDTEQKASDTGPQPPKRTGVQHIAEIEAHKVRTGETLEKLAEGADLTWQELAKFNWETDDPQEINEYLYFEVGCTHKTQDGKKYVFDDSDEPGIVYVPGKWENTGLATGRTHVIQVSCMYEPPEDYHFSM